MAGFDIHVDATELSADAESFLIDKLGFWRSDFCGHPEGYPHYEPPHHLTLQPSTSQEYKPMFKQVRDYFAHTPGSIRGYIEGEYFAFDEDLEERPYEPGILPPFRLVTTSLPPDTFRESEIHVTMSRDESDPRLAQTLIDMGLFTAYLDKKYGVGQVFTVQGTKTQITEILTPLFNFLKRVGGSKHCSVKEERVVGWWLSGPGLKLPPVTESIVWNRN